MGEFSESVAEDTTLAWLESLGWTARYGPEIAPGELAAERKNLSGRVPEIRHLAGGELGTDPACVKIRHTPSGVLDDGAAPAIGGAACT